MALSSDSTGKEWNARTLVERKEYVTSLAKVLTVISNPKRTIDGTKLFALTEKHFEDAANQSDSVLEVMGQLIRDNKVG
ncbi:MAG: hypothetical protein HYV96_10560 [Opitutae bacterium]|nr:hypothetical protein [Opitutae bacterium]